MHEEPAPSPPELLCREMVSPHYTLPPTPRNRPESGDGNLDKHAISCPNTGWMAFSKDRILSLKYQPCQQSGDLGLPWRMDELLISPAFLRGTSPLCSGPVLPLYSSRKTPEDLIRLLSWLDHCSFRSSFLWTPARAKSCAGLRGPLSSQVCAWAVTGASLGSCPRSIGYYASPCLPFLPWHMFKSRRHPPC